MPELIGSCKRGKKGGGQDVFDGSDGERKGERGEERDPQRRGEIRGCSVKKTKTGATKGT